MTQPLVKQPTARPTRKLTAAAVAGVITELVVGAIETYAPDVIPPLMRGAVLDGVSLLAAVVAGYLVHERAV